MVTIRVKAIKRFILTLILGLILYTLSSLRTYGPADLPESSDTTGRVHLVVVACQGKTNGIVLEASTMIKSAMMFSTDRLNIHIFTDTLTEDFLREESLPNIDSILYVDTDVIFMCSVQDVWEQFDKFNNIQVAALASRVGWDFNVPGDNPNFILMPSGKLTQVNAGVFLMNLTRMRREVFRTDPDISKDLQAWHWGYLKPLYLKNKNIMHGDQNLVNIVFHYNPDLLHFMPCKYNYHHKFCFDKQPERKCDSAENEGAAVIHGSANTFYNNYAPAFAAVNKAFRRYDFGDDLKLDLLQTMLLYLSDHKIDQHAHCGGKKNVFTLQLRKTIKRLMMTYNVNVI